METTEVATQATVTPPREWINLWYLPQTNDWSWTIKIVNTFTFELVASDHNGVLLKIGDTDREIGHERVTVNAGVIRDPIVQEKKLEIANGIYRKHSRKGESNQWRMTEAAIYDYMVKETKRRKKQRQDRGKGIWDLREKRHKRR